jgi:hypothetical protein
MEDLADYLRDPFSAALIAAAITALYINVKQRINNEGQLPLHAYTKPAILNGIMVYFIVSNGLALKEPISTEPF